VSKEKKYCLGLFVALVCCHSLWGQNNSMEDSTFQTQPGNEKFYDTSAPQIRFLQSALLISMVTGKQNQILFSVKFPLKKAKDIR
jgi:hypothetical protein